MAFKLSAGFLHLAVQLQEAATDLSANDIENCLRDCIQDAYKGTGTWAYYIDHFGDCESGDVIYSCGGETKRAAYEMSMTAGQAATCTIDTEGAECVRPRTVYEPEADEADHYASMEESFKAENIYTGLPLYERFISKSERKSMGAEDFAGKNRSFPIKAQADVDAAFHSLGRAGSDNYSSSTIRSNIIKIAKRKGYKLPKSAQEKTSEAARGTVPGMLQLVESAGEFLAEIPLRESRTNYPIKLISPGTGTTAHYPANVLEAAAPQFKAGTLMFWNHPTAAEEASRPEGDLNNLAAITTSDARWDAAGVKGPGLYAEAKVMADYAEKVEERAPHIGLSIRAGGKGSGKMVNGKPELASIDYVESVDYVTKAGRGGLALAEAARDAGILPEEVDMTEAEIKTFVADTVKTAIREALAPQAGTVTLLERRALRGDAQVEASRILESMSLPDVAKAQVLREVIGDGSALPIKDGALDSAAFKVVVENAAKEQGRYVSSLLGGGRVAGMGASLPGVVEIDAKEAARLEKQERKALKRSLREGASIFQELGLPEAQAERAALGRVS